jgi:hypothetical protein
MKITTNDNGSITLTNVKITLALLFDFFPSSSVLKTKGFDDRICADRGYLIRQIRKVGNYREHVTRGFLSK